MAVENKLSTIITNANANPPVLVDASLSGASLRVASATLEVAAADDDGSTFRFFRIPSNARVHKLEVLNDAITAGTSYDFGLYQTAANGGAVVDADAYASAVDLSSARTAPLDVAFEARNIDKTENRVWQDAGLTADSNRLYDIVATANTIGSAAGTISVKLYYTVEA